MPFSLMDLPYAQDALQPGLSADTLAVHHGKHHAKYVATTNAMIAREAHLADASLVDVIRAAHAAKQRALFNNAAQIWNHNFYWHSLTPDPEAPGGHLANMIASSFGGMEQLVEALVAEAVGHFSNGWVWLMREGDGLVVRSLHDADTPLVHEGARPLLTLDVWEHAYYIDYRNARDGYAQAVLSRHLNWGFAARNLDGEGAARADQQQA
ncbi:MAG: superoxide dismutase [Chakrabartia sp.]